MDAKLANIFTFYLYAKFANKQRHTDQLLCSVEW